MSLVPHDPSRRILLQSAAAGILLSTGAGAASQASTPPASPPQGPGKQAPGKPGEFDFLAGEWRIKHRRLKSAARGEWDEFEGEATCWTILGGIGSVEELRIPARDFSGMGLRLLDLESRVWSDFWVNAKSGALGTAGLTGGFVDGDGIFESRDVVDGKPMIYRGVWDRIVFGKSHRWYQASSGDDGKTWDINWTMDWERA
jgi:hypothetical protein